MSNVRLRRLQADYEKLRAFLSRQPRIRLIQAQGSPPERYQLEYQIRGLREVDDQLQTVANHMVEIALPLSYPRLPPQCRMLTPVFHPNIAPHAICIGDHWNAGEPLWSMVARIGEMLAYQSYNTKSPLNGEAARWVESHLDKLPLDKTNFMLDDAQPTEEAADPSLIPLAGEQPPPLRPASDAGGVNIQGRPPSGMDGRGDPSYGSAQPAAPPPRPVTNIPVARLVSRSSPPMAIPLPAAPARPAPPVAQPAAGSSGMDLPVRPRESSDGHGSPSYAAAPPSNIVIQCGQCGSRYSVPSADAGKKVRCKKCQGILVIPALPSQP